MSKTIRRILGAPALVGLLSLIGAPGGDMPAGIGLEGLALAAAAAQEPPPAPPKETPVPEDPFELRPQRKSTAPATTEALPPIGLPEGAAAGAAGAAATVPGGAGAAAAGTAPAAAAATAPIDPRAPRKIMIDEMPLNASEHTLHPALIDTSIALNLKRMEKEPERRWSLRFAVGTGDVDVEPSIARARLMEQFARETFGSVADVLGEIFDFGWSDEGPTEPSSAPRIEGNLRYRILPTITLEAQAGRSNALTDFTQPGFRFDERAEVMDFSVGPMVTLPFRLWRFGFFAGGGAGLLRGKVTSEVFLPSFGGQPVFLVSEATGSSSQYYLRAGGEAFITRFASFTIEGEYRKAEINDLKYTEETMQSTTSARAINETDTPYIWTDYVFDFENQVFGWIGDPNQPLTMDFTGVSITAGLRYHW
jgi:hypothetical protein